MSCESCKTHQAREQIEKALLEANIPYFYCPNCGQHIAIAIFLEDAFKEVVEDENGKAMLLDRPVEPAREVSTLAIKLENVDISREMELLKKHSKAPIKVD